VVTRQWWHNSGDTTVVTQQWWHDSGDTTVVTRQWWHDSGDTAVVTRQCWHERPSVLRYAYIAYLDIIETQCVHCAVRTESLCTVQVKLCLYKVKDRYSRVVDSLTDLLYILVKRVERLTFYTLHIAASCSIDAIFRDNIVKTKVQSSKSLLQLQRNVQTWSPNRVLTLNCRVDTIRLSLRRA
jgi:hypothetical protein